MPLRIRKRSLRPAVLIAACVSCLVALCTTRLVAVGSSSPCGDGPRVYMSQSSFRELPVIVQMSNDRYDTLKTLPLQSDASLSVRQNKFWVNHGTHYHKPVRRRPKDCVAMAEWQDAHHPSCLLFHEIDLNHFTHHDEEQLRIVGSGFYRSVWMMKEYDGSKRALKTLRYRSSREEKRVADTLQKKSYHVDFNPQTMEQQRIDAVVMEELSLSPYIADIYGYCSTSALVEYSNGGDLQKSLNLSYARKKQRLEMAVNVAAAVADTHHVNADGYATIAHTDLNPSQFLRLGKRYKLNDFNRAKLLSWNKRTNTPCPIASGISWRARYQSPEEHLRKPQSEKLDVFTMGMVLYNILTNNENSLFPNMSAETRHAYVKRGGTPKITDKSILKSKHPFNLIMRKALKKCWILDPKKRASAQEIADMLQGALKRWNK